MNAVMALAAPRGGQGGNAGMWIWGPLLLIVWLALAVLVTWLVIRLINGRAGAAPEATGAEWVRGLLAERHAKGEISTEEYNERLAKLG
jgi:putative membrane protein